MTWPKFGYPVNPAYGEEVLKTVKEALDQPEETTALLINALKRGKD